MKKTIIALLSLSGVAMGTSITLDPNYTSGTVLVTLDVDSFSLKNGGNFTGGADAITLFEFSGTWSNEETGNMGVCSNGSSTGHYTGFYGTWTLPPKGSGAATSLGLNQLFNSNTNWGDIEAIAVAYSFESTSDETTNLYTSVSIRSKSGVETTYASRQNAISWSSDSTHFSLNANSLTINDDYVLNYSYSNQVTTGDKLKALSAGAVPEPTTATLSLLALAGLAARRRRK